MKAIDARQRGQGRDPVLAGLAAVRRRRVLAELRAARTSLDEPELARQVASGPASGSAARPYRSDQALTQLHHVHLPTLAEASLVEWNRQTGAVSLADNPVFEEAALWEVVDADATVDEVLESLADPFARSVLSILRDAGGRIDRARLAATLLRRDPAADQSSPAFQQVLVSLRHERLPKLAEAGLVRDEGETVVATGDDRLAAVWPLAEVLPGAEEGESRH